MEIIHRNDEVPDGCRNDDPYWTGFAQDTIHGIRVGWEGPIAVESTGNTRYFKRKFSQIGYPVTVINPLKFKVINGSVKKTDRHDAATIAEFLEKDMLPKA